MLELLWGKNPETLGWVWHTLSFEINTYASFTRGLQAEAGHGKPWGTDEGGGGGVEKLGSPLVQTGEIPQWPEAHQGGQKSVQTPQESAPSLCLLTLCLAQSLEHIKYLYSEKWMYEWISHINYVTRSGFIRAITVKLAKCFSGLEMRTQNTSEHHLAKQPTTGDICMLGTSSNSFTLWCLQTRCWIKYRVPRWIETSDE